MKWPRFAFEKFAGSDRGLSTHMKSVGEAMAIGRTFQQAFAKAMRSRELDAVPDVDGSRDALLERLERPTSDATTSCSRRFARARRSEEVHERRTSTCGSCGSCGRWRRIPSGPFAGARSYSAVDTCAAEFAAETPYFYSGWERDSRAAPRGRAAASGRAS